MHSTVQAETAENMDNSQVYDGVSGMIINDPVTEEGGKYLKDIFRQRGLSDLVEQFSNDEWHQKEKEINHIIESKIALLTTLKSELYRMLHLKKEYISSSQWLYLP